MIYVDTSLIISALDPEDPSSSRAYDYLSKNSDMVVSELVIAEMTSVLFRSDNFRNLIDKLDDNDFKSAHAVIIYLLDRFRVSYFLTETRSVRSPSGTYSSIISFAITIAPEVPMKTLDLMHISYAYSISTSTKSKVKIATRDREFETFRKAILERTGIEIVYLK